MECLATGSQTLNLKLNLRNCPYQREVWSCIPRVAGGHGPPPRLTVARHRAAKSQSRFPICQGTKAQKGSHGLITYVKTQSLKWQGASIQQICPG